LTGILGLMYNVHVYFCLWSMFGCWCFHRREGRDVSEIRI